MIGLAGGAVNKVCPGHDAGANGQVKGAADGCFADAFAVQVPDFLAAAFHAVADLGASGPAHPAEHFLIHTIHPRNGHPDDIETAFNDPAADVHHQFPFEGKGIIGYEKEGDSFFPKPFHLCHEVVGAVKSHPAFPKCRRAAEGAPCRASPRQGDMLKGEMTGGHGQAVQVRHRLPIHGFIRYPRFSKGQAGDVCRRAFFFFFQESDQFQETVLAFAANHVIDLWEMSEKMFPEEGGANAAEHHGDVGIDLFGHAGDVDPAPSVGVQDGKPHHIRPLFAQHVVDAMGGAAQVVAVEDVHRISVGPEHGPHVVKTHGDGTDILFVDTVIEKIGVDKQYFHGMGHTSH